MNRRRVLIADDEPLARERLSRMLATLPDILVCAEAANGDEVLAAIDQHDPDILLLDIRMPGRDGLEVAVEVHKLDNPPAVIFCTAYDDYALRAFDVPASDYLLKPVRQEALVQALARAGRVNRLQRKALATPEDARDTLLTVSSSRGTELVDMTRVRYCEADQKYVILHHDQGGTLTDLSLRAIEQRYPDLFLRTHRNTLAGTRHLRAMEKDESGSYVARLHGDPVSLPVSRRHIALIRNWLSEQGA